MGVADRGRYHISKFHLFGIGINSVDNSAMAGLVIRVQTKRLLHISESVKQLLSYEESKQGITKSKYSRPTFETLISVASHWSHTR